MSFRVLACLSFLALSILFANGAPPETKTFPNDMHHISISRLKSQVSKRESPNLWVEVDANCSNVPLRDFLSKLGEQSRVSIHLDEREIADTQGAFDKPITIKVDAKISLKSTLSLALEPVHLDYYLKDGRVVVTNESFILRAPDPMKQIAK